MTDTVTLPREVVLFLYGIGELDGHSFGERNSKKAGLYWWREHLRAALDAPQAAPEGWQPIESGLPAPETCVLVYTPPRNGEEERFDFDGVDEDGCWVAHNDSYENFCIIGGVNAIPGEVCTGPSETAPYTHWMPLPEAPNGND